MVRTEISAQLAALTERVAALEAGAARPSEPPRSGRPPGSGRLPGSSTATEPPPPVAQLDLELVERLRSRSGPEFVSQTASGSVLYAGAATVASGSYVWQMERPVPGLLAVDDDVIAQLLDAMSSPIRVRLLKAVLGGARETHELQAALGGVSAGQLYHHLKELTAAGLLVQEARGRYDVPAANIVPILAVIAAVYDLAATRHHPEKGGPA